MYIQMSIHLSSYHKIFAKMEVENFFCKKREIENNYIFSIITILVLLVLILLNSCEDIFETDLSNKNIILIAPGDSLHTDFSSQTFYWEQVKGALTYRLQIVSPHFNAIQKLVLDTSITFLKFSVNLSPGLYEWRVRAENGSSKTLYVYRYLQIDSTLDLAKQKVLLTHPADNIAINNKSITFSWSDIYNATGYNFQLWEPDLNGSKIIDTTLNVLSLPSGSNLPDGNYTWGVKAFNNNTNTDMTFRKFMIDRTVPSIIPTLVFK